MRHGYKYLISTGIIFLFLILCPCVTNAQKQLKYLKNVTKTTFVTSKVQPKVGPYVPKVSPTHLPPTTSGALLGIPVRQVIISDSKSVKFSIPKESIPGYFNGEPAIEHDKINQSHQRSIPTNSKVDNTLPEIVPEIPPKEVNERYRNPYNYEMLEQMKQLSPMINSDINRCCIFIYGYVEGIGSDVIDEEVDKLLS